MNNLGHIGMHTLRKYILVGQCPWCNARRSYVVLAQHTSNIHSVSAKELRELAGLNRFGSICDPEYSKKMSDIIKKRPPELQERCLAAGRTPQVIARRDYKLRPEGKENQLRWLLNPERIEAARLAMNTPEANAKSKVAANSRSPKVVKTQTERVLKANADWRATHTEEEISEKSRRGYRTWLQRTNGEEARSRFVAMGKMVPHEAQVKAAAIAKVVIPIYHANPEWKARWRRNMEIANEKRRKVGRYHFAEITRRYLSGKEKTTAIALDYGISRAWVRKIALGLVGGGET